MLTLIGGIMIITFMVLIMTKKMTPVTALVIVPVVVAIVSGFGAELGAMMESGVKEIGSTGVLLVFAILYFSLMIETGLFEPLISLIVKLIGRNPVKITIGTVVLSALVSLDGDGSSTYLIVATALLPIYRRLGINPLVLSCLVMLTGGVTNILPWGGPTARVLSALNLSHSQVFTPLVPIMFVGFLWVVFVAYYLGYIEKNRGKYKYSFRVRGFTC